eukprot:12710262-Alexandrium_andersonii.AAC.1
MWPRSHELAVLHAPLSWSLIMQKLRVPEFADQQMPLVVQQLPGGVPSSHQGVRRGQSLSASPLRAPCRLQVPPPR